MSDPQSLYVLVVWAHADPEEPISMLYEAAREDLSVSKMVEIYSDGRVIREELGDEPKAVSPQVCLCEGTFTYPNSKQVRLHEFEIDRKHFDIAFERAATRTF